MVRDDFPTHIDFKMAHLVFILVAQRGGGLRRKWVPIPRCKWAEWRISKLFATALEYHYEGFMYRIPMWYPTYRLQKETLPLIPAPFSNV